jgi:UDP:flavonoid glycosyltransferase YjiC (YdhE family)
VCLHDRPLDIERAASTAELCVCHAGHGTVSVMLRAGVPMLLIPLHLEQALVARRTETLGAAVVCRPDDPEAVRRGLQRLLIEPGYTQAARRFAKKYDQHDTASALRQAVQIVEEAV